MNPVLPVYQGHRTYRAETPSSRLYRYHMGMPDLPGSRWYQCSRDTGPTGRLVLPVYHALRDLPVDQLYLYSHAILERNPN